MVDYYYRKFVMCTKTKSSFTGVVPEIPGIAIDNFEEHNLRSRAFFLSHCHSDHMQGLFSNELMDLLRNDQIKLYMSNISASIVADEFKYDNVSKLCILKNIKPLKVGTSYITLPALFDFEETFLRVTLINASHCLGSVMFLFELNNKTILYTGDFNISSSDICNYRPFHNEDGDTIHLDGLYVDTTFITYEYKNFPKRSVVVEKVVKCIKDWLDKNRHKKVALSTSAKYGYEYVYNEIYNKIGAKVFVNDDRWTFYKKHEDLINGITNNESETRIHVCRDFNEHGKHKLCALTDDKDQTYLFMRFSAMKWDNYDLDDEVLNKISDKRINVCFPTHCSRTEIIDFVNYFQPKNVVGFPNTFPAELLWNDKKLSPKKRKIDTPNNKKLKSMKKIDRKVDKDVIKRIFDL